MSLSCYSAIMPWLVTNTRTRNARQIKASMQLYPVIFLIHFYKSPAFQTALCSFYSAADAGGRVFGSMGGGLDSEEVSIAANSESTKTSIQVK